MTLIRLGIKGERNMIKHLTAMTGLAGLLFVAQPALAQHHGGEHHGGGHFGGGHFGGHFDGGHHGEFFGHHGGHHGFYGGFYPAPYYGSYYPYAYGADCFIRRRTVWTPHGYRIRRIRVCM